MERPRITIANITPREMKLFEQIFDLDLRIQNPNDSPLAINGLTFELEINEKPFASGVSDQTITIGRLNSDIIRVKTVTTLWSVLRQVADLQRDRNTTRDLPHQGRHLRRFAECQVALRRLGRNPDPC